MEFRNAIAAAFEIDISATAAFDYPTVSALARHISGHLSRAAQLKQKFVTTTKDSLADSLAPLGQRSVTNTLVVGMACIYPTSEPGVLLKLDEIDVNAGQ